MVWKQGHHLPYRKNQNVSDMCLMDKNALGTNAPVRLAAISRQPRALLMPARHQRVYENAELPRICTWFLSDTGELQECFEWGVIYAGVKDIDHKYNNLKCKPEWLLTAWAYDHVAMTSFFLLPLISSSSRSPTSPRTPLGRETAS